MYMGFLLPSLYALKKKLKAIDNEKLVYCTPLLQTIIKSIKTRFEPIWKKNELILASCLIPRFKLIWLDKYNQCLAEQNLKTLFCSTENDENDTSDSIDTTNKQFDKAQIFFCLPLNNQPKSSSADEIKMYLKSPLNDINMLLSYPKVIKFYLEYNTPMPSSAPVERLFSTGSNVMTVKRYRLGDELFEKLVLLKQNKMTP